MVVEQIEIGDKIIVEQLILFTFVRQKPIYKNWRDFTVLWWDPEISGKGFDYRIPNWWYNRRGDKIWI